MDRTRPYVLIVDDAEDGADTMCELLGMWKYDAEAKYTGAAALAAARGRIPAAVVLDFGMVPMDGLAFAAQLRGLPGCNGTLVVAVSGHTTEKYQVGERDSGIDHHLAKPPDLNLLKGLLERHCDAEFAAARPPLAVPVRKDAGSRRATPMRPVTGFIIAGYGG